MLVSLPRGCFDRYVTMALMRRYDFNGHPTTPEWEATYLEWVEDARKERAKRDQSGFVAWKPDA